jgi:Tol biopolymer transport system component
MSVNDPLVRSLEAWLHEEAAYHVPDHLDTVLRQTSTTRQRPAWSSLGRWLPMDTTFRRSMVDPASLQRPLAILLIIALVVAALVAIAVGSRQSTPPPYGLARNGLVAYWASGDIYLAQPDGSSPRALVPGETDDLAPLFSRDGTHLAFLRQGADGTSTVMVARADGSDIRPITTTRLEEADWYEWDAGDRQAVVHTVSGQRVISIIDTSGALPMRTLDLGGLQVDNDVFWSPTDQRLFFTARPVRNDGHDSGLYAVDADGQNLRALAPTIGEPGAYNGLAVSPDGKRLAFWNYERDDSADGMGSHLHYLDLETGLDRQVTFDPTAEGETDLRFSPDGTQVVFQREAGSADLMIAPADASAPGRYVGGRYRLDTELYYDFSPDGASLLVVIDQETPTFIDIASGQEVKGPTVQTGCCSWQRLAP